MTAGCNTGCWQAGSAPSTCDCVCRGLNHGFPALVEQRRNELGPDEFEQWRDGVNAGRRRPRATAAMGVLL